MLPSLAAPPPLPVRTRGPATPAPPPEQCRCDNRCAAAAFRAIARNARPARRHPRPSRRRTPPGCVPRPSGSSFSSSRRIPLARSASTMVPSMPSRPIGLCVRMPGTASAAMNASGKPMQTSRLNGGLAISRSVRFQHRHAGALAAHQRARHVEPVFGQELVQVVARHAARYPGELLANQRSRIWSRMSLSPA